MSDYYFCCHKQSANCWLFILTKHNEGAWIHAHALTVARPHWLVHFYITLSQMTVSAVFMLANWAPQTSPTGVTIQNLPFHCNRNDRVTVACTKKIIMSSLQFSTQLYKTFPELDRLKLETLKLYWFCFRLTSFPLGSHVWEMPYKLRLKK